WSEAFAAIAARVSATAPERIGAISGDLAAVEDIFALQQLMQSLDVKNVDGRGAGEKHTPASGRGSYLFNPTIAGVDEADAILVIGTTPRHEAAVLNARLRKRWREEGVPIALIGEPVDLTYPYQHLGVA